MNLKETLVALIIIFSATKAHSFNLSSILDKIYNKTLRPDPNLIPQTKCIEGVECFNNYRPWYQPLIRPYSAVPEDLEDIEYHLYTSRNPNHYYSLNGTRNSIQGSPFNPAWNTKILIHGFHTHKRLFQLELDQKDALLSVGKYNIIVLDYRKYSGSPYYQAAANIRVLAARVALLLKALMNQTGVKAENMHCIAPSLGAHACGYIGKRIANFGRISALSPAGPYFGGTAEEVHLTPSDALFVDIINTAAGGLGTLQHFGHQNFFPEGGFRQPGCYKDPSILSLAARIRENLCDHVLATFLYLNSIKNTNCTFRAVNCSSYADFLNKKCPPEASTIAVMGFHAKPIPGIEPQDSLYLRTGSKKPYCVQKSEIPRDKGSGFILERRDTYYEALLIREAIVELNLI